MSILRVTLHDWRDLGVELSTGSPVGTVLLPAKVVITPTISTGSIVDSGNVAHGIRSEKAVVEEFPWSYDLTDPVGSMPEGWGYIIEFTSKRARSTARITFSDIENVEPVEGIRNVDLRSFLSVSTSAPDAPWIAPAEWLRIERAVEEEAARAEAAADRAEEGGWDDEQVAAAVDRYFEDNPPEAEAIQAAVQTHVESPAPHPVYDDAPRFDLIVQNAII